MDKECDLFKQIFSVLSKDYFLINPKSILSYMRDVGFSKPYTNLLETVIDIDARLFVLSLTCFESEIENHVKQISEDCFINSEKLMQIILSIRSSLSSESTKTNIDNLSNDVKVKSNSANIAKERTVETKLFEKIIAQRNRTMNTPIVCDPIYYKILSEMNGNHTKSITIPDSETIIEDYMYKGYSSLEEVHIPESITAIGKCAFSSCTSLKEVYIPNSVKTIGDSAFLGCTSLKKIYIPNSVKTIGDSAFYGCKSLETINIPNSIENIQKYTFGCCESLKNITIPNSVKTIGDYAFAFCKTLKMVSIPESVVRIGNSAFNCTKIVRDAPYNWNF